MSRNGVVSVEPLDRFGRDGENTTIVGDESPISPRRVSLATIGKCDKPSVIYHHNPNFENEGVSVMYHIAYPEGVGDTSRVQTGRGQSVAAEKTLYVYGYGGLRILELPMYGYIFAVLVLKCELEILVWTYATIHGLLKEAMPPPVQVEAWRACTDCSRCFRLTEARARLY